MADTTTTNLGLTKPEIGAAEDTWGISLNNDLDAIDAIFSATGTAVSLNIDGGDIASAVTINKSPVITLGGDLSGNVTLTNLASGTLTATVGTLNQNTTGNAATATALATGRNFSLTGNVTASAVSFDGTGNVALATTLADDTVTSAKLSGALTTPSTLTVTDSLSVTGTTPTMTIGDGGEEDIKIILDGNATDYYIGLRDSGDKFVVGKGQTLGTDQVFEISDGTSAKPQVGVGSGGTNPMSLTYTGTALAVSDSSGTASVQVSGGNAARMDFGIGSTAFMRIYNDSTNFTEFKRTSDHPILFGTNSTERMRILGGGNVGIGTSSPSGKLEVGGGSSSTGVQSYFSVSAGYTDPVAGNAAHPGGAKIILWDDSTTPQKASIGMDSNADIWFNNAGAQSGGFTFYTGNGASATPEARLTIKKAGNIGIGTTSPSVALGVTGAIIASDNITAYGTPSDIRLKENIKVIDNALDKVKQLKGITYDLKSDGNRLTGLIAQDLQKVLPEAVYETSAVDDANDKHLAIRYGNTVGLLVEAIKEQQQIIEDLKLKIEVKNGNRS